MNADDNLINAWLRGIDDIILEIEEKLEEIEKMKGKEDKVYKKFFLDIHTQNKL
jgi:hypothetical protein